MIAFLPLFKLILAVVYLILGSKVGDVFQHQHFEFFYIIGLLQIIKELLNILCKVLGWPVIELYHANNPILVYHMKLNLFLLVLGAQTYFHYGKLLWLLILDLPEYLYDLNWITDVDFKSEHVVSPEWRLYFGGKVAAALVFDLGFLNGFHNLGNVLVQFGVV